MRLAVYLVSLLFCCANATAQERETVAEPLMLDVIEAAAAYDARNNTPLVSFRLSEVSKRAFADFSSRNVGKKIDIRLDGKTVMQTVIREPIMGGGGQIITTSSDEAQQLAHRLILKARLEVQTIP
jgi:preprotein translocase subunit SecD